MNEPMSRETESVEQAVGKGQAASLPLLRVSLFGEFELAWQVPSGMGEAAWESRTSARALFKLLLCAPGRQATKSMLAGILWPETDEQKARESLRSACKVLRKVVRTANGEELLEQRSNGKILKLAEQSRSIPHQQSPTGLSTSALLIRNCMALRLMAVDKQPALLSGLLKLAT